MSLNHGLLFQYLHEGPWWVFCDWVAVPLLLVTANQTTVAGLTESGVSCCLTGPETLDSKNKCTRNHCDLMVCACTVLWARGLSSPRGPAQRGPCSPRVTDGPPERFPSVPSLQAVTRRAKVAPADRMSKFLKHFTVVGDDYHAWNINYKKWENEEEEEEEPPPTPASGAEGRDADPTAAPAPVPRPRLDFRTTLRKLFSAHRFQVGGQRPEMPGVRQSRQQRVTRAG